MVGQWGFARIERLLDDTLRRTDVRGVAVLGEAGSGKSTAVARVLADRPTSETLWITPSPVLTDVAFGSLVGVVPIGDRADPAATFEAVLDELIAAGARRTVVVDDAQYLDESSGAVLRQFVLGGHGRPVVIAREWDDLPAVLRSVLRAPEFPRLTIPALTLAETAELAGFFRQAPVTSASAVRIHGRSQGNPLVIAAICASEREGHWRRVAHAGSVHLRRMPTLLHELADLYADELARLPDRGRLLLRYLAIAGSLDSADVRALGLADEVPAILRNRLAKLHPTSQILVPASAALVDAIRAGLDQWTESILSGNLVRLQPVRADDALRELRCVTLSLRSDIRLPEVRLLAGADLALRMGAVDTAIAIARAAVDSYPGTGSRVLCAAALSWSGRSEDAEELYAAALDGLSPTPPALAAMRSANLFWGSGLTDRARLVLSAAADHPRVRGTDAAFSAFEGRFDVAIELAEDALADPAADPAARLWAASALSLAASHRLDAARSAAASAAGLAAAAVAPGGYQRFAFYHDEVWRLMMSGDLRGARIVADRASVAATGEPTADALARMMDAMIRAEEGDLPRSVSAALEAHAVLEERAATGWAALGALVASRVCAMAGDVRAATETLASARARFGPHLAGYEPLLWTAAGWVAWAEGRISDAGAHLRHAHALALTMRSWALVVDTELSAWRTQIRCPGTVRTPEATALLRGILRDAGSGTGAEPKVIARAADAGWSLLAAEIAARVPPPLSAEQVARVEAGVRGPAPLTIRRALSPSPLSAREKEVVRAVRRGLTNAQIAAELHISVRTVEGHVFRASEKLAVPGRRGLRSLAFV